VSESRPAVVFGLLWAGLALARSLGRRGIDVTGIASGQHEFGLRSRYLRRRVVESEHAAVLAALRRAATEGPVVLFPERDAHIAFCLEHWDEVRSLAAIPLPDDPEVVLRLRRKEQLAGLAEAAGVDVPRTAYPESEEAVRSLDLRPPLLVKPVEGQEFASVFGRKLFVAEDRDGAARAWRTARDRGFATVVQELIPEAEDKVYSLFTYIGQGGEPLANVVGRKVRAGPPRFGTAAVFELGPEPRVLEIGLRLLRQAGYRGFAQVELALDVRDGDLKLLEVNTRPPQWGGIAMTRRFDVARIAYDDLCGRDVKPAPTFDEEGVAWIYLAKDLWSSLELARHRELGARAFAAPYVQPKKVRAIFAADDPLPALASIAYLRTKVA